MQLHPRFFVFGDVHGCASEMFSLFNRANIRGDDTLISCGDLINKGPRASEVVSFLRNRKGPTIVVRGNHEQKLLDKVRSGNYRYGNSRGDLSREDVVWLSKSVTAHEFISGEREFAVVHAGIPSTERRRPLPRTDRSARSMDLMHLRYESPSGERVDCGAEKRGDTYWADRYDGLHGFVFFGHQTWAHVPQIFENAAGLDGGCVYGGKIAGAMIHRGEVQYYVQRADRQYLVPRFALKERGCE